MPYFLLKGDEPVDGAPEDREDIFPGGKVHPGQVIWAKDNPDYRVNRLLWRLVMVLLSVTALICSARHEWWQLVIVVAVAGACLVIRDDLTSREDL